ncbi:hypothetical protein HanIR_Chr05g0246841 [Helianthus annuus]|nr:hypothetical protein HanIR_Chr05g0246841 [Helianthus annuus]
MLALEVVNNKFIIQTWVKRRRTICISHLFDSCSRGIHINPAKNFKSNLFLESEKDEAKITIICISQFIVSNTSIYFS